ncbi:hypothetical protein [Streptomyces erythrochromogenes]|uniref:hypothetical protein n=1 Tax=Streptomyces erythrochromogenes TaxID=285574 RepID=UPI003869D05D|nr:hypothetical protein OG364_36100 [Streptomyces erythrochromogenes]
MVKDTEFSGPMALRALDSGLSRPFEPGPACPVREPVPGSRAVGTGRTHRMRPRLAPSGQEPAGAAQGRGGGIR